MPDIPTKQSAEDWLRVAQQHRAKGWLAATEYALSKGLKEYRDHPRLLAQRAQARIEMQRWRSALRDVDRITESCDLSDNRQRWEAHLIAADALYGLQLWGPAQARLRQCAAIACSDEMCCEKHRSVLDEKVARVQKRAKEAKFGNKEYDWEAPSTPRRMLHTLTLPTS